MFTLQDLKFIQQDLSQAKILVVGDVMLDRYWFGEVSRISPEAPVPVAKINQVENRPGGAANVARNISTLGGSVSLLSVVGEDEHAKILQNLLIQESINFIFQSDPSISTIVKLRVLAKNQQLLRIDFEEKPSHEILAKILDKFKEIIADYSIIVLSDYGKGGLSHIEEMIRVARNYNKLVLVDPKGNDYTRYHGASLLTPNKSEFQDAVGKFNNEAQLQEKAIALKHKLDLKHLLITRSEEGMSLFSDDIYHYPTLAREIYDVSGAGDTVIASLALMLANNATIDFAASIANLAAGMVVAKVGTATITKLELIEQLNLLINKS